MSIDDIHERVLALLLADPRAASWRTYLDIGSGNGDLIEPDFENHGMLLRHGWDVPAGMLWPVMPEVALP